MSGHTSALLGIPRNVEDLEIVEFADVLGAIAEDRHCSGYVVQVQKSFKLNNTIMERSTKFWETKTRKKNKEMSWMKLTEKLICWNRYLFLVTQSPRKNVQHLGFDFLAVLALRSGDYIETCDIYREKHSCRCYPLPELHKTTSMQPRLFDQECDNTKP